MKDFESVTITLYPLGIILSLILFVLICTAAYHVGYWTAQKDEEEKQSNKFDFEGGKK